MDAPELLGDEDYRAHADFRYAMRRYFRFSEVQARAVDLTPQQFMLLLVVRGHPSYPAVTITEIAERLQVRHHSASLLVDRCVRRGFLHREQDTVDRRRVAVCLTDEGQQLLERITLANRRQLRSMEAALVGIRASLARMRATAVPT